MASSRLRWPALSFPPINLWVMPAWQKTAVAQFRRHMRHTSSTESVRTTLIRLLAARGGNHGNQD